MKVFQVVTERDGQTERQTGGLSTEVIRDEYFFAAEKLDDVWKDIAWLRNDPERTVVAIVEKLPQITILQHKVQEAAPVKRSRGATVEDRVKLVVAEQLGHHVDNILLTDGLVETLGADSLDLVELVMAIEEEFNIELDDDEDRNVRTVGDVIGVVRRSVFNK